MRFHIETLGCKVNTYESQYYAESLKKTGLHRSWKKMTLVISVS